MKYEDILKTANYLKTVALQRDALKSQLKTRLVHCVGGGLFRITPELINLIKCQADMGYETLVVLDDNENPIQIADPRKFLEDLISTYAEATNAYYAEMEVLRQSRTVAEVVETV